MSTAERTGTRLELLSEDGHARRALHTKQRVLDAAIKAFARDGYGGVTVEGIAKEAGVAPASLYNHFAGKAGLAQAVAERALSVHEEYLASAWELNVSPLEQLFAAAGATVAFALDQPTLFRAISLSYLSPIGFFPDGTPAAEQIAARRHQQLARVTERLEAAISAGELRPLDAPAVARFLVAAWAAVLSLEGTADAGSEPGRTLTAGIRAIIEGAGTSTTLTRHGRLRTRYEKALAERGFLSPGPHPGQRRTASAQKASVGKR